MYNARAIDPSMMNEDLIGKSFISPPSEFRTKKKDVPVETEHPLWRYLLPQKHRLHTRRCGARHLVDRAKQGYSGA